MLLFVSCDHQITKPEPEEKLLDIPRWGKTALPFIDLSRNSSEDSSNVAANEQHRPGYAILKKYARAHPEDPYVGIAGVYYPEKEQYRYEVYPLDFDEDTAEQGNIKLSYYSYRMKMKDKRVYRIMGALIPASEQAITLMTRWLAINYSKPTGAQNKFETALEETTKDDEPCFALQIYEDPETGVIEHVRVVECFATTPDVPGGGGGPPPPPEWPDSGPDGPSGCQGEDCGEPPFTHGGNTDDGTNDGNENEDDDDDLPPLCEGKNPPDFCAALDIIIEDTFKNNPCLSSVYAQAGKGLAYQNILNNFDDDFSVANLILSAGVDATFPGAIAVTYPPSNYNIEIMFNPNNLHYPSLEIAAALIHELIHAGMYRKLLSVAQQPNIPWTQSFINSIRNDFPGIFDYYSRYKNWQHQQMAAHYRNIMEQALRQFNGSFSNDIYEALAWEGLQGTDAWENNVNLNDLQQIFGSFRQNNPSCDSQ